MRCLPALRNVRAYRHSAAMSLPTDIRVREATLFYLPIHLRVPLKFGAQVVEHVVCARVRVRVEDASGRTAEGWGETPLSVAWVWPAALSWDERETRMKAFCEVLARELVAFGESGHPMELGDSFQRHRLHSLLDEANHGLDPAAHLAHLAALVCHSLFDLAIFDAFGQLHQRPVFETLGPEYLSRDLADFLDGDLQFAVQRPAHYLRPPQDRLPACHLLSVTDPP